MKEIWVDIKGYEGAYQVSNMGRVKSLDRIDTNVNGKSRLLKGVMITIQHNKRNNVYMVMINKDGSRKAINLHRLVAEHFVENEDKENKTTVNHIDGDRSNNKADNLEWCSYGENLKHAYDKLNRRVNRGTGTKPCKSYNKETEKETPYESIAQASRETGVSETQIRRLIAKECINAKYEFSYI